VIFQAILEPVQADHGYPGACFYQAQARIGELGWVGVFF
jgi:hypothetical protein